MKALLELREVCVDGRLQQLSLDISKGERICLLGSSGSGKTTLLNLANGSLMPDRGVVSWGGSSLASLPRDQRRCIGTLWQDLRLVEELNVARNINAGALGRHGLVWALRNLIGSLAPSECLAMMKAVELDQRLLTMPVSRLSGGQRQRVALARLLRQNPVLVLADEPLSALDPSLSALVIRRLLDHPACLISLHRPDLAHHFDRVIGLRRGRLVMDIPARDLDRERLEWLYEID